MKVTDYIISYLEEKGIKDIFGYPGAVVCHLMDSTLGSQVHAHVTYHEQGAAFAACGYAQTTNRPGVAYANVGPGATNLTTGIANAWFDSIPCIFITGQVDNAAMINEHHMRQKGIQEMHADELFQSITKYAVSVKDKSKIVYCLERAYYEATSGRPGPVLLEIPADIQRSDIDVKNQEHFIIEKKENNVVDIEEVWNLLLKAERPCFLLGNGIKQSNTIKKLMKVLDKYSVPCVSSLPAMDILPNNHPLNMGYIGMNAHRYSNFVLGKSDLIVSLGSRMDLKQVGVKRENFALSAKLVRVDIDNTELDYKVREDEISLNIDLNSFFEVVLKKCIDAKQDYKEWIEVCKKIKEMLYEYDMSDIHYLLRAMGKKFAAEATVVLDVGQHLVYGVQSLELKDTQNILLSLGLASMGYAIPAAIGAYYGNGRNVYVICGDGGFQMNLQELQFITRENLPIKIIVLNNNSLGMIREFQERNFNSKYTHSVPAGGYVVPDIKKIAYAYGIEYFCVKSQDDLEDIDFANAAPAIIELIVEENMYLTPRMDKMREIQDMVPELENDLYNKIMEM